MNVVISPNKEPVAKDVRVPIFVTRHSLSPKTAVGVQTAHYLQEFPDWRHLHWAEFDHRLRHDRRSMRIESLLVARWPGYAEKARGLLGVAKSWWTGDRLCAPREHELVTSLAGRASALYLAPMDVTDAARMRYLAEVLGRPFVLHIWDSLNSPLLDSADHRWLIAHAAKVFALTGTMANELRESRPDVEELLFVREPTRSRAREPETGGVLRVGLLGFLRSYRSGLRLLLEAYRGARTPLELRYIGSRRTLDRLGEEVTGSMTVTGHLRSGQARDRALAACHVAMLPGPMEAPEVDLRSRYSIPSRVLDFMAVGLPVVGTVHPESATANFCREMGIAEHVCCQTAEEILEAFRRLREPQYWERCHQASLAGLARVDCAGQIRQLRKAMEAAGAEPASSAETPAASFSPQVSAS